MAATAENKGKKRKSASEAVPTPKKQKKADDIATRSKKSDKLSKPSADGAPKHSKSSRKRAEDFFSDDEAPAPKVKKSKKSKDSALPAAQNDKVPAGTGKPKPSKPSKQVVNETSAASSEINGSVKKSKKVGADVDIEASTSTLSHADPSEPPGKTTKKPKKGKQVPQNDVTEAVAEAEEHDEAEDLDDQTAALLAGFESDRDESDLEKEDQDFDVDAVADPSKKVRKQLEAAREGAEPGVIYLGRLPHGFFEPQMKKYFNQFGTVTRLRLSRNKKTGASKHFAFIEFANADVAEIVAKTMHNYLMFGHILQCRVIPAENVHAELFKDANKRFRPDPRNKKAAMEMVRGVDRSAWEKRVENENKRRQDAAKDFKETFGYEYSAPAVKPVGDVPTAAAAPIVDGVSQELLTQGEDAQVAVATEVEVETTPTQVTVSKTVTVKKPKAGKKNAGPAAAAPVEEVEEAQQPKTTKEKKSKKRQSDVTGAVEAPVKKTKKSRTSV